MVQQGVSANVTCHNLGLKSNITWLAQEESLVTTTNGATKETIFMQNITFGPNDVYGFDVQDNLLITGPNFIATFDYYHGKWSEFTELEFSSYGSYRYNVS